MERVQERAQLGMAAVEAATAADVVDVPLNEAEVGEDEEDWAETAVAAKRRDPRVVVNSILEEGRYSLQSEEGGEREGEDVGEDGRGRARNEEEAPLRLKL